MHSFVFSVTFNLSSKTKNAIRIAHFIPYWKLQLCTTVNVFTEPFLKG